jgi:hypothetical protein
MDFFQEQHGKERTIRDKDILWLLDARKQAVFVMINDDQEQRLRSAKGDRQIFDIWRNDDVWTHEGTYMRCFLLQKEG